MPVVKSNAGLVEIATLQRSAVDDDKDKLAKEVFDVFKKYDGEPEFSGDYPGWKPNVDSPVLNEMKNIYEKNL